MTLLQFSQLELADTQDDEKSCAAVACMIALKELGLIKSQVNKATALEIYQQIQKAPKDESPVGNIALFLIAHGAKVEILRSDVTKTLISGDNKLKKAYEDHKFELKEKKLKQTKITQFEAKHFDQDARLFLSSIIVDNGLLHQILARKDGNDVSTMNPDSSQLNPTTSGPKQETRKPMDKMLKFLNTAQKVKDFSGVEYAFTGIAIRVTR